MKDRGYFLRFTGYGANHAVFLGIGGVPPERRTDGGAAGAARRIDNGLPLGSLASIPPRYDLGFAVESGGPPRVTIRGLFFAWPARLNDEHTR